MPNLNRYDRQERIKEWKQNLLQSALVMVCGAGALGNEVIKNLTLAGVGHILIVDSDIIEYSNLSRCVLFTEKDLGKFKAQTAAESAIRLNPEINIRYINGDILFDIGLGFYRHVDLVISGLDNHLARVHVSRCCRLAGVPFLDGGMWGDGGLGGEVRWFGAGDDSPCYECGLDKEEIDNIRYSCTGLKPVYSDINNSPMPSTITITSVIGGMLAQEAVRYLSGWEINFGKAIVFNGMTMKMYHSSLLLNPQCEFHHVLQNIVELSSKSSDFTALDIITRAESDLGKGAILELGRDFLLSFHCNSCNSTENIFQPAGKVSETRSICPDCKKERRPDLISQVTRNDPQTVFNLNQLGTPIGDILALHSKDKMIFYEFTRDIMNFL